jgi:hypothetical protein
MTKTLKLSGNTKVIDISKEMKRYLDMLPGMADKLREHYTPIVRRRCSAHRIETTVEFVEAMPAVGGLMFAFVVHMAPHMLASDLADLCMALDYFTGWEDEGFEYEGYNWRLGDGDDTQAVYLHNGKLCIWARGWKV